MTTIARAFQGVRPHIPMIKFPNRSDVMAAMVTGNSSSSVSSPPSQTAPSTAGASSKPVGATPHGSGIDFMSLPLKYQRPLLTPEEMAYIENEDKQTPAVLVTRIRRDNMASYSERDISLIPDLTFLFVENNIKSNKSSSGEKSINKGFKHYSDGYIHE